MMDKKKSETEDFNINDKELFDLYNSVEVEEDIEKIINKLKKEG